MEHFTFDKVEGGDFEEKNILAASVLVPRKFMHTISTEN